MRSPTKTFGDDRVVIGLTGGIGSGKSTVLEMFRKKGARTIDSDAIVHGLLKTDKNVLRALRHRFGFNVFSNGRLDRKKLGAVVFKNTSERIYLEKLLHPLVRKEISRQICQPGARVIIVDVPLLFESGWNKRFKRVIVVNASIEKRFARLKKRGLSNADIRSRMRAQWPLQKKVAKADFVVDNNRDKINTKKQIQMIWHTIAEGD